MKFLPVLSLEQAYGQQSYGTYGQPTDVSYSQAQSTATYGQTAYATSYGQPPTGKAASESSWGSPWLGNSLSGYCRVFCLYFGI